MKRRAGSRHAALRLALLLLLLLLSGTLEAGRFGALSPGVDHYDGAALSASAPGAGR